MQPSSILSSVAQLLWPVVVAILVIVLLPVIRGLIKSSDSVNVEVGGAKISVQRAAEDIRKLISDLQDRLNAIEGRTAAQDGTEITMVAPLPRANKILWVDDRPDANVYERARAEDAGYKVIQASSTATAMRALASEAPMELIITDMARIESGGKYNTTAGLDLIKDLREAHNMTPVVVYSSTKSLSPVVEELKQLPNVFWTTSPTELVNIIGISAASPPLP